MREIVPDQRRPLNVRYWIIIPTCLILAVAVIIYAWSGASEASPKLSHTPFLNQKDTAHVGRVEASRGAVSPQSSLARLPMSLLGMFYEGNQRRRAIALQL